MSSPLEHDYIGLSEVSTGENSDELSSAVSAEDGGAAPTAAFALNLKETELRLGLPGSRSTATIDAPAVSLTLGLPKSFVSGAKRAFSDAIAGDAGRLGLAEGDGSEVAQSGKAGGGFFAGRGENGGGKLVSAGVAGSQAMDKGAAAKAAPAAKAQVVGWPPIRSYRKNTMASSTLKNKEDAEGKHGQEFLYVKVSMDGAPYLRKVDLKMYSNYKELSSALEKMFTCFTVGQCGSNGALTESRMMDFLKGSEYVLTYEDKDGDWMLVGDVPWDMFTDSCRRLRVMKGSDAIGIAPRAMEKSKSRD